MCGCKDVESADMLAAGYVDVGNKKCCGRVDWQLPAKPGITTWKETRKKMEDAGLAQPKDHDPVNHPKHYASEAKCSGCGEPIEAIDVIRHLGFNIGNSIKYLWRAGKKDDIVQDLKKAIWYIEDQIAMIEGRRNPNVHRLSAARQEEVDAEAMWKQANPAIGKVLSSEETEKGLEIQIQLKACEWGVSEVLRAGGGAQSYDFECRTHGYHMIMPIDKPPAMCDIYKNMFGNG